MNPNEITQPQTAPLSEQAVGDDQADTQLLVHYCHHWEHARQQGLSVSVSELCRERPDLLPDLLRAIEILDFLTKTKAETTHQSRIGMPTIPGYDILAEIGRGGMGVVYKARQLHLNRNVALKLVSNPNAQATQLLRFRQEAESIARLQHPNIVQIFETGVVEGLPFLAIEYVDGITLKQRTAGVPQPPFETARLVETIARAVHHAHDCRIIHRDLKPQNILLSTTGVPKVTDFGLARSMDVGEGLTLTSDFLGTPAYAAPEQVLNKMDQIGPWTDVYSLGAMLYELLTGHVPFEADSLQKLLRQVAEEEPTPVRRLVASCPFDLQTICMKCLEKEPAKRYQTAAELADDLRRFQADEPIRARPSGAMERIFRWGRRNPAVALLLLAVGSLLSVSAIGGGLFSMHLATALREAKKDRDRATTSERQTREHLAESRAAAAKLALQMGNGRVALEQLDAAVEAGLDTPVLRFLRVKALCAIHDVSRALEESRSLASRNDLGELAGEVQLWKADLELDSRQIEVEAGLRQIRLALDRGLPIAEQHYAHGLLAKSVPEAVNHFRKAVQADPTNPRTNMVLAMLLVFSGEFPEARERLVAAQLLFPEHPVFVLIQATMDAFLEMPGAVNQHLTHLRRLLGNAPYTLAEGTIRFCEQMTAFVHDLEKLQCGDSSVNRFGVMLTLQQSLAKVQSTANRGASDLYLPFPPGLIVELKTVAHELPSAYTLLLPGNSKALAISLEQMAKLNPDAFFLLYAGTQRVSGGDLDDWRTASELFQQAINLRSMLPVRRMCLFAAAMAESILERDGPQSEKPGHRAKSMQFISQWAALDILPEQASKILMHCERMNVPPELTWRVYAAWERADKGDKRLPLVRARLYVRSHDYESAIRLAEESLKLRDDPAWRELREAARTELQRRSEAVLGTTRSKDRK